MAISQILSITDRLFSEYDRFRADAFPHHHIAPEVFHSKIDELAGSSTSIVRTREAGKSFESRIIRIFSAGSGKTNVLLWSQMHGDESTATIAIADVLNYLIITAAESSTEKILKSLTLHFLPMLNPDGAARCQRRTAQGIDMNRDALALVTPEARVLKQLQKELQPQFGFNLHDQELSTAGTSRELSAIGLLAPAFDESNGDNDVRRKAKLLAAVFAGTMRKFIGGKVARYDDTFEPRAFGDNMQKWGTSTLLVESGHAMNDPEKSFIRKLNFVGILTSLYAIATGEYIGADIAEYESLPFNGKKAYDVILRNIGVDNGKGVLTKADLGISYQVNTHSEPPAKLVDIGDLSTFVALKNGDGKGVVLPQARLVIGSPFEWEKMIPR